MIVIHGTAQEAETVRLAAILIGVSVAFFWRVFARVALAVIVIIVLTTIFAGAFALTHPAML